MIILKIIAILIIAWVIPTAFNPKYRYNEHCKWEPELSENIVMLLLGMFLIWMIII